jgi:hypothetical protein
VWSTYPWLASGIVIASDMFQGLYVLRPDLTAVPECSDGIDDDVDGQRDYPDDTTCVSPESPYEGRRVDVEIDVAPLSRDGVIRLWARRPLLVLLHGSRTVDVGDVDLESLRFGPNAAAPSRPRERLGASHRRRDRPRDVDRDGFPDLLLRFERSATGLAARQDQACLRGELRGDPFEACEAVEVVERPCGPRRQARWPWSFGVSHRAARCADRE